MCSFAVQVIPAPRWRGESYKVLQLKPNPAERNDCTTLKVPLSMAKSIECVQHYLYVGKFVFRTNCAAQHQRFRFMPSEGKFVMWVEKLRSGGFTGTRGLGCQHVNAIAVSKWIFGELIAVTALGGKSSLLKRMGGRGKRRLSPLYT